MLGTDPPVTSEERGSETLTTYHTPAGPLTQVVRRTEITAATRKFLCAGAAEVEQILEMPYEPPALNLAPYREAEQKVGEEGLVIIGFATGLCWVADLLSPEDFCLLWADAPEVLERAVEVGTQRLCAWLERACPEGVAGFRVVGPEYASVELGPPAYERLVVNMDSRACQIIRRHGGIAHVHQHGPMTRCYDLIRRVGMNSIDPLEAAPWGDCDLAEAKARIGDTVCLLGNMDDMEVLGKWPRERVLARGRELIEQAGPGGFILGGTSSGTYTEYAVENFIALRKLAEEMAAL
jgi:uroporphyrinogen-III decarboxylase